MKPWTIAACAGLAVSLSATTSAPAGDLNPPPGAIAPTMKPLDSIEPRVCVNTLAGDEGATHRITQPGTYVFSSDVVGENGKDGLRVECDAFPIGEHNLVIALQGFSLRGVQGAANAIFVHNSDPTNRRVHITITGSVRDSFGNPASLISGWSVDGVHVEGATSVSVEGLRVSECVGDGFECVSPPSSGTSVRCFRSVFSSSGQNGVTVTLPAGGASSLEIQEVQCLNNLADGARITYVGAAGARGRTRIRMASMDASHNAGSGLHVSGNGDESISMDMDDLRCSHNGGHGTRMSTDRGTSADFSAHFHDSSSSGNVLDGFSFFVVSDGPGGRHSVDFRACSSSSNGGDGFACDVSSSSSGVPHSFRWDACSSSSNTGSGFYASSLVSLPSHGSLYQCRASDNGGHGTEMESMDESIDLCDLSSNTGAGVYARDSHVRCSDGSCRSNGGAGIDVADATRTRSASMDHMVCPDNGGDGIVCNGLASLHVSSSSCGSNGRGPGGGGGLACGNTTHFVCDNSNFEGNTNDGAVVFGVSSMTLDACRCVGNGTGPVGGSGVVCTNVVECCCNHLIAADNTGDGGSFLQCSRIRAQSCDFSSNDIHGMRVSGGGGAGGAIYVSSSSMRGNTGSGLSCADFDGDGRLDVLTCSSNGGDGVRVTDFGLGRVTSLDRCVCSSNGSGGIVLDSLQGLGCGQAMLSSCETSSNVGDGISLTCTTGGSVRACVSSNNGGTGILVAGNNHVVTGNTVSSNVGGPLICPVPGNSCGPLVDEVGIATNCNPAANYVR